MTTVTTTRVAEHPRPSNRPSRNPVIAAVRRIVAVVVGIVVGVVAGVALAGTASAVVEPFVPSAPMAQTFETVPAPVTPAPSGWSPTTVAALVVVAALIAGLAFLVQRTAHRRHQTHGTALPG